MILDHQVSQVYLLIRMSLCDLHHCRQLRHQQYHLRLHNQNTQIQICLFLPSQEGYLQGNQHHLVEDLKTVTTVGRLRMMLLCCLYPRMMKMKSGDADLVVVMILQ